VHIYDIYCETDSSWKSMCYFKCVDNCDRSISDGSHERRFSIELHHFKLTHSTILIRTRIVLPIPGKTGTGKNARLRATSRVWRIPIAVRHRNTHQIIDCPIIALDTRWLIGCTKSTDPKSVPTLCNYKQKSTTCLNGLCELHITMAGWLNVRAMLTFTFSPLN